MIKAIITIKVFGSNVTINPDLGLELNVQTSTSYSHDQAMLSKLQSGYRFGILERVPEFVFDA